MNLDYELFKGVSFRLESDGSDVDTVTEQISSMRSVKRVWPVRKMSIPDDKIIWKGTGRDAAAAGVAGLQATNTNNTFSPLLMTQVDHLHAEGITGEGIKIAVIDTGIDYTVSEPQKEKIYFTQKLILYPASCTRWMLRRRLPCFIRYRSCRR